MTDSGSTGSLSPQDDSSDYVQRLLADNGFTGTPGFYQPAHPLPDGRWSVDPDTLALLLTVYARATAPSATP